MQSNPEGPAPNQEPKEFPFVCNQCGAAWPGQPPESLKVRECVACGSEVALPIRGTEYIPSHKRSTPVELKPQ